MGQEIKKQRFSDSDFVAFSEKLNDNLKALESMLNTDGFGQFEHRKIGCELELYLIDKQAKPVNKNKELLSKLNDRQFTLELNQYNLEYNLKPERLDQSPFTGFLKQFDKAIGKLEQHCAEFDCHPIPIGILPTVKLSDFGPKAMTDLPRYHALTQQLQKLRGGPFHVNIEGHEDVEGQDKIEVFPKDVTLEGANTSLQLHFQVTPQEFADSFNAFQLITPLMIAFSANSPLLFGNKLWHETRVPLFKQSIDCRRNDPIHPEPARVNYGHGWVRHSAMELFEEAVRLYQPLLPICTREQAHKVLATGKAPKLSELRLQQGSVWLWNRPVYDPAENGHLRIEARALPAGPSKKDMITNMVVYLGLMQVVKKDIHHYMNALPFDYCKKNFYRAAKLGFDAKLIWPNPLQNQPTYATAHAILMDLIPKIPEALKSLDIVDSEVTPWIKLAIDRLEKKQNGATWQLAAFDHYCRKFKTPTALKQLVLKYQTLSQQDIPIADWPITD